MTRRSPLAARDSVRAYICLGFADEVTFPRESPLARAPLDSDTTLAAYRPAVPPVTGYGAMLEAQRALAVVYAEKYASHRGTQLNADAAFRGGRLTVCWGLEVEFATPGPAFSYRFAHGRQTRRAEISREVSTRDQRVEPDSS